MTWIDTRTRTPTETDADENGNVLQLFKDKSFGEFRWELAVGCIAWMTTPKFTPAPDPLPGYRLINTTIEPFDSRAMWWDDQSNQWRLMVNCCDWVSRYIYCIPIEPPQPKYRPFKNAAEFRPFAQKEWRQKIEHESTVRPPEVYSDIGHGVLDWEESLDINVFCDGTPFGMKE